MTVSRAELETILSSGEFQLIRSQVDNDQAINNLNYKPQDGAEIIYLEVAGDCNDLIVININDDIDKELKQGEQLQYGTDDGETIASSVRTKPNGETVINDGTDYAVKYSELKSQFEEFKSWAESHVHDGVIISVSGGSGAPAVGVSGSSAVPTNKSTADITKTKVEKVRL